jgi:TPR repeat protein
MISKDRRDPMLQIAAAEEHLLAKQYIEAARIYRLLAADGNTFAKVQLGYFCENGLGEEISLVRAAEFYESAMKDVILGVIIILSV